MFVSTQDGWTALHLACQECKFDVVRLLLTDTQTLVNIQNKVRMNRATVYTAVLGEVTVSTQDGWTALHIAVQEGRVEVVRILLTEAQTLVTIPNKVLVNTNIFGVIAWYRKPA